MIADVRVNGSAEGMMAIDEGGPATQFITEFGKHMGELAVLVPINDDGTAPTEDNSKVQLKTLRRKQNVTLVKKRDNDSYEIAFKETDGSITKKIVRRDNFEVKKVPILLFECRVGGYEPQVDEKFENVIFKLRKYSPTLTIEQVKQRAKVMYRAIGRIFLHCMVDGKNVFPSTVLPRVYMNAILRNCYPHSNKYNYNELLLDAKAVEFPGFEPDMLKTIADSDSDLTMSNLGIDVERFNCEDKIITIDNFRETYVYYGMIRRRDLAINAIKNGLTLNGKFPIHAVLKSMPIEAIERLIFSKAEITPEDVIKILDPIYSNHTIPTVKDGQMKFFDSTLKGIIQERGSRKEDGQEFLHDFIEFITGSKFLPSIQGNPGFRINIAFNCTETNTDNLPTAHTCINTMTIPGGFYNGDANVFQERLDKAFSYGVSRFNME